MACPAGLRLVSQECVVPGLSGKGVRRSTKRAQQSITLEPDRPKVKPCLCPSPTMCVDKRRSLMCPQSDRVREWRCGPGSVAERNKGCYFDGCLLSALCVLGMALIPEA